MKSALALAGFAIVCIAWAAGPQSSLAGNGHSITSVNGSVKAAHCFFYITPFPTNFLI